MGLLVFTGWAFIGGFIRAWFIQIWFNWFVSGEGAYFSQLGDISYWQAAGLSMVLSVVTLSLSGADADREATSDQDAWEVLTLSVVKFITLYGMFWVWALIVKDGLT